MPPNQDNRVYKGYWWLSESPEKQVAGMLTVCPDGESELDLFGGFGMEMDGSLLSGEKEVVIFGRCYDPAFNMTDISLIGCHPSTITKFSNLFPLVKYACRFTLIGIHLGSMEEDAFFKTYIYFDELPYWCHPRNVSSAEDDTSISLVMNTSGDDSCRAEFNLVDGSEIYLRDGFTYKFSKFKFNMDQSEYLEVVKEEMNANHVLSLARDFGRFLSVATRRQVEHRKITLFSKRESQVYGQNTYYHPIELVTPLYIGNNQGIIRPHAFLLRYEDVADSFGNMFVRLQSEKGMQQILSNLIDSLEKKKLFTSNDFLVVIQALDGFMIRFSKTKTLLDGLKSLRNEFSNVQKVNLSDEDLMAAKDSRHYYSHVLDLKEKDKRNVLDGTELYNLTKKLRGLLLCCILKFMGFENTRINALMNKCYNPLLET